MSPTRCISSLLTTELLKFRNPHGLEENWILNSVQNSHSIIYYGKMVSTTIGASLLCVTTIIEMVAYLTLSFATIPLLIFKIDLNRSFIDLTSSASFTFFWNIGNATVFNAFCDNLFTHESFARFSMVHWPRGRNFQTALIVSQFIFFFFSQGHIQPLYMNAQHLRLQDLLYITEWVNLHQASLGNTQLNQISQFGYQTNGFINEGTKFFKDVILERGQIHSNSRDLVLQFDSDVFIYVLTRCVYIYALGSKKNDPIPQFFKIETQNEIRKIRNKYPNDEGKDLEKQMKHHLKYENDHNDPLKKTMINELKAAANTELQNSLFLTKCWQQACTGFTP